MKYFYPVDTEQWQIPVPVRFGSAPLFKLSHPLPQGSPTGLFQGICIAYTARPGYFEYPNEAVSSASWERIRRIFLIPPAPLGRLTAAGLFHTALIPLFHNRVQQRRRNDAGLYLWERGGRLDQWLDSCRFPNFSSSGLRDFEHLEPAESSKGLRHYIGEHILSFILVLGSCFRSQAPERRGWDSSGRPADTRDLFDSRLFTALITGVCRCYFRAFADGPLPPPLKNGFPRWSMSLSGPWGLTGIWRRP